MVEASASPEKQLFISLITRDVSLADAIIDLTDNSVNAAMKALHNPFTSPTDFHRLFSKPPASVKVAIQILFDENTVTIRDDAEGIDFASARDEIFRFGHSADYKGSRDRLSVYGIGMKRGMFKLGNDITMQSDHRKGGFNLKLNVPKWAVDSTMPWTFPISARNPSTKTGTEIKVGSLHKPVVSRLLDPQFERDLMDKLSKVYSFFLGRVVSISVNGKAVKPTQFQIGSNFSHESFKVGNVSCAITGGIASASGDRFPAETAGWFIFCNFRTVIYADKGPLSGWGHTLPIFQPKHRPFLGMVSFTSADPEALPWTTTKAGINEDDPVWQSAKVRMLAVAKPIIRFLDSRYSADGTDIEASSVTQASGKTSNVFDAAVSKNKVFAVAGPKPPKDVTVQYKAKKSDVDKIRAHFSRSSMSASEVGKKTFDFFLRNEVGEK